MHSRKTETIWLLVAVSIFVSGVDSPIASAQQAKKSFTVADEIALALFDDPNGGPAEMLFSPDGEYFVVKVERGRSDIDRVEDAVRFYRTQDVNYFLGHSEAPHPSPVWTIARTAKEGGIIGGWRWLADSSGIAFLEPNENGNHRLVLADLRKKNVELLTSPTEVVQAFDIRDRQHYVYAVAGQAGKGKRKAEHEAASVVGTGRSLFELILPDDPITARIAPTSTSLWAVLGSKRFEVKNDGVPLANFGTVALSPDGRYLITTLPVVDVPSSWEALYPPPTFTVLTNHIHAGHYDAKTSHVHQYVRIDLQIGSIQPLTDAPLADDAGWLAQGDPSWANDGHEILLPNTFLRSKANVPSRPCVAVLEVSSGASTCVELLKAHITEKIVEEGYHIVFGARFAGGTDHVLVAYISHEDQSFRTTDYQRRDDTWQAVKELLGSFPAEQNGLGVRVEQGLNDPPMLVATNRAISRVIWDPNPQLKNIELGQASVYTWKDKEGREWKGGLYKPVNYKPGHRYPLVIQTHGFSESEFRPSGMFPTAFAARALAAMGIMVLQTWEGVAGANCPIVTTEEGPCAVAVFESATKQLVLEGLVDQEKIGIIGFSRTCFYVTELLTTGTPHLMAASITDGVMFDYLQYVLFMDRISSEADRVIGAPPFGEGLQQWLKRSPGFRLDKIDTPLLVVGEGPSRLLSMWQPYAGLRYLHKPVDLIMLNTDEHVLTNPAVRMASQGGTVDWFRFWLQGYEDPDPAKQEQYKRWRGLRKMQQENDAKAKVSAVN